MLVSKGKPQGALGELWGFLNAQNEAMSYFTLHLDSIDPCSIHLT